MNPPRVRAAPSRAGRTIPLKLYLFGLAIGILLPIVLFTGVVLARLAAEERAELESRVAQDARALASSLDREMVASIRALEALGESDRLDRGDLVAFGEAARRVLRTEPSWLRVHLLSPDGRQLVNTRYGVGPNLPPDLDPESLRDAVATRRPEVGSVFRMRDGQSFAFSLRVPVIRAGEVRYVISALTTPQAIAEVVSQGTTSHPEWMRTVVDKKGAVAAGTLDAARLVGQPLRDKLLARTRVAPEGVLRDTTPEAAPVYVAYSRSELSGWTCALTIPANVLDGPARRSLLVVLGIGLALLLVSGLGAVLMSQKLSRAIRSAESAADALAQGGRPTPAPSSIAELAHLGAALQRAAELLGERARERDQHLARAEALRLEAE
ncbi:MAG: hybrid sensor histidine kinase/response regulator, partial [Anaeromyxobacteraceae bacterium]